MSASRGVLAVVAGTVKVGHLLPSWNTYAVSHKAVASMPGLEIHMAFGRWTEHGAPLMIAAPRGRDSEQFPITKRYREATAIQSLASISF